VHYRDDEGFWIIEGSATFEVGDATIEAGAGDYLFGPRNIPHRYPVGPTGCRMQFILVPGGIEDLIRETSELAPSRSLPPVPDEEPTPEEIEGVKALVKGYGRVADLS
jgi:Cupin domain